MGLLCFTVWVLEKGRLGLTVNKSEFILFGVSILFITVTDWSQGGAPRVQHMGMFFLPSLD